MTPRSLWSRLSAIRQVLLPVVGLLCFASLAVTTPGCTSQQIAELKAAAEQARDQSAALDPLIEQIETDLAEAEASGTADPEVLEPLQDALAEAKDKKAIIDAKADAYLAAIQDVDDPVGLVGHGMQVGAPLIPQPWGTAAGILGGALVALSEWRRRQTQAAAESIVLSFDGAKNDTGGVIDFGDNTHRTLIRSRQTEPAKRLVDKVQQRSGGRFGILRSSATLKPATSD
ncbi:MAG: hypothetical protein AAGF84_03835 [Planctomycetota bacterium]